MSTFKHFLTAAFVAAFSLPASAQPVSDTLVVDLGNGTITVEQTQDCFFKVDYFNTLAETELSDVDLGYVQIHIEQGDWTDPETFTVTTLSGWTETHVVEENNGATVCVPWPVMG